jgi:hypothetical protein
MIQTDFPLSYAAHYRLATTRWKKRPILSISNKSAVEDRIDWLNKTVRLFAAATQLDQQNRLMQLLRLKIANVLVNVLPMLSAGLIATGNTLSSAC